MQRSMTAKLALIGACVLATAMAAVATAGTDAIPTKLKISESFPAFHGKVTSDAIGCEVDRPVKLFEIKRNGDRRLLGKTRSDFDARWEVIVDPLSSGAYQAKARERTVETAPRGKTVEITCEADLSRTVVVD